MEIILTLSVLAIALVAFIFEWFPVDLTALTIRDRADVVEIGHSRRRHCWLW